MEVCWFSLWNSYYIKPTIFVTFKLFISIQFIYFSDDEPVSPDGQLSLSSSPNINIDGDDDDDDDLLLPLVDNPTPMFDQSKRRKTIVIIRIMLASFVILLPMGVIYIVFVIMKQQSSPSVTNIESTTSSVGTTATLSHGTITTDNLSTIRMSVSHYIFSIKLNSRVLRDPSLFQGFWRTAHQKILKLPWQIDLDE